MKCGAFKVMKPEKRYMFPTIDKELVETTFEEK